MLLKIVSPAADTDFQITGAPAWPSIPFKTDGSGQHTWKWKHRDLADPQPAAG